MKNLLKILLLVILTNTNSLLVAQEVIKIDFDKLKEVTFPEDIKVGDQYVVEIKNINLNLYKVSINSKDSVFSKALETPSFGNLSLDALSSAVAAIGSFGTSFIKGIESTELESLGLKNAFMILPESLGDDTDQILKRLRNEQVFIEESTILLTAISSRIDQLKMNVYKTRLFAYRSPIQSRDFGFDEALGEFEQLRLALDKINTKVVNEKGKYDKYIAENEKPISTNDELKKIRDKVTTAYTSFITTSKKGQTILGADNVNTFLTSIVFLENNRDRTYKSLPMQFNGEQAQLTLKITPREEKFLLQTYETTYSFPKRKNTYVKLGLSFYYSKLHDEGYTTVGTQVNDSTKTYQVLKEDFSTSEIGIASFIRFGWKFKKKDWLGAHFAFGPGMSISNKVKPRILYGGGLTLGKKHMVAIDIGAASGYVARLSSQIPLATDLPEKPESTTVTKLDTQIFVAIGYVFMF